MGFREWFRRVLAWCNADLWFVQDDPDPIAPVVLTLRPEQVEEVRIAPIATHPLRCEVCERPLLHGQWAAEFPRKHVLAHAVCVAQVIGPDGTLTGPVNAYSVLVDEETWTRIHETQGRDVR